MPDPVLLWQEDAMEHRGYTGLEFMEGFSLLAGALWIIGALAVGTLVMMGSARMGSVTPAANQTPVAEMPTQ
ncbi:MAG: hypothetical protein KJ944_13740 [Alphaproteobacteria bacterium]|jgi:hypothetical protein|uniref:hypothetical protein n=1 Tax=Devosia sp. XGJD_8 TaxID=3391187 RepID=UPI001D27935B|nr:hypothetical protein [Alphaproteobacteria bacterium]MBU1560326.1 hypothetical protein [Alphaproteobacteria bacterium]MBU2303651.1 hypothetical protein [Alphaproteobacteria bacterium]MBU2366250.1 hypothetical protein [Alphaproteobacteria bacterium]